MLTVEKEGLSGARKLSPFVWSPSEHVFWGDINPISDGFFQWQRGGVLHVQRSSAYLVDPGWKPISSTLLLTPYDFP